MGGTDSRRRPHPERGNRWDQIPCPRDAALEIYPNIYGWRSGGPRKVPEFKLRTAWNWRKGKFWHFSFLGMNSFFSKPQNCERCLYVLCEECGGGSQWWLCLWENGLFQEQQIPVDCPIWNLHVIESVFFSTQIINLLFILSVDTAQISLKPSGPSSIKSALYNVMHIIFSTKECYLNGWRKVTHKYKW